MRRAFPRKNYQIEAENVFYKKPNIKSTEKPPAFDFDNPQDMTEADRQRLIEYMNMIAFNGEMKAETKKLINEVLKLDKKEHDKILKILDILEPE